MTHKIVVTATRHADAPLETVWHLLGTVATWPQWARVKQAELEQPGYLTADGVGAVRKLTTSVGTTRERVVAFEPPAHLGYELVSGLPLVSYSSDVTLAASPSGGTDITWRSSFLAPRRSTAWLWRMFVTMILTTYARRLATNAARESHSRPAASPAA